MGGLPVRWVEAKLGNSPDPLIAIEGRGLLGKMATLSVDQQLALAKIDGLVATLAADRAAVALAAETRKTSAAKVIGWIAGSTCTLIVGAITAWVAGFHR